MRRPRQLPLRSAATAVLGLALAAAAAPLAAQGSPDFLFDRPALHLDFRAGLSAPRARSQIFDFTRERLTVERADLRSPAVAGGIGYRITEQLDLALELGYARAETTSEFREWEDAEGRPIVQTTRFTRVPVTLTLRGYLWDRGRSIGRFAWVPSRWAPYLGAGAGWVAYDFTQTGDFVDYRTLEIFSERYQSSAGAAVVHALAGAEVSLSPRLSMSGEARYSWASAPMGRAFEDFDDIDLSGFQATLGLSIRL